MFEGDLSRFDRVGWQMDGGQHRRGRSAGDYAGALHERRRTLVVDGDAGSFGRLRDGGRHGSTIGGDVGDFAASTLPGSIDGMRGGTLIVRGDAGARFGDRMRRGTALVFGDAGDFAASRMVAGTIAHRWAGRRTSSAYGMRRGIALAAGRRKRSR